MPKVTKLQPVTGIRAGVDSTILDDGTIQDPEPYEGVDVELDDGVTVQVERPLTKAKLKAAYDAAVDKHTITVDEVSTGDVV